MIKYSLQCEHNHLFEGWFRNSDDCEAQRLAGHLQCPICGSSEISKSLMAPSVTGTRSQNAQANRPVPAVPSGEGSKLPAAPEQQVATVNDEGQRKLYEMMRSFREHVVANSDYVGDQFAEEARKIHFKETEARGIYGEASVEDVKGLVEDGIECLPLPGLPEDQN